MNKNENINKLIEEAIGSVDGAKRAVPLPFLHTRVNARLKKNEDNIWEKAGWFIGRPSYAIPGLIMLMLVNVMVIIFNRTDQFTVVTEQSTLAPADEFSYTVATLYDTENIEP